MKNAEYRDTASIQHYIVLEQAQIGALVFTHQDERWVSEVVGGDRAVLRLPAIGVEIGLSELYAGVPIEALAVEECSA